jgi:hypothetical protein
MNGARGIDVDELFDRNADTRLLERRRSEELGLPPIATAGSTTPARFGPESMVGSVPLAAPRGAMLRVALDARPNRELIPGAVVTVVAEVADDGDTDADDVLLRIAIPPESEPIAGSFARDGVELDGEALLGEGLRVGTIPAAGAIRLRFALRVLPGTEPLDVVAYAQAPGVPAIAAPSLRLGRRSGHAAYEAPKPFFELEPDEVDEDLAPVVEAAPVTESAPVIETPPVVETSPVIETAPVSETAPVRETAPVIDTIPATEADSTTEATPAPATGAAPVVETAPVIEAAALTEASLSQPEPVAATPPVPEAVPEVQPRQRKIDFVVDEPATPVTFPAAGVMFGPPPSRKPAFERITPPPFVLPPDVIRHPVSPPEPVQQAPVETPVRPAVDERAAEPPRAIPPDRPEIAPPPQVEEPQAELQVEPQPEALHSVEPPLEPAPNLEPEPPLATRVEAELQPASPAEPLQPEPESQLQAPEPEPESRAAAPVAEERAELAIRQRLEAHLSPESQALAAPTFSETKRRRKPRVQPEPQPIRPEAAAAPPPRPEAQAPAEPAVQPLLKPAAEMPVEAELPPTPVPLVLARVLDADEVRALERVFVGTVPHGLAALALLSSVAAADAPLGRALGVAQFAKSVAAALPRALVAARMNRPPPPVVTPETLAAIRPDADAPQEEFAYEGALLVARLEPRELTALRTLLARQLEDPFLRGVQVLLAIAPRDVENVAETAAARLRHALAAYRVAAGAWLMRVTVRRAVDKRYDPLTADDPTLHDAGRVVVAALREAVS